MEEKNQNPDDSTASQPTSDTTEDFEVLDGRRFAKNTKYLLPNDAAELDRLKLQHYIFRQIRGGNFCSPLEASLQKGIKVLDAGCGCGIWSIEMAREYPNSMFVGTDAVETYPAAGSAEVPPNCTFLKADTLRGLPFGDAEFDFVFQRVMVNAFTPTDWEFAIGELARVCKAGGWAELVELGGEFVPTVEDNRLWNAILTFSQTRGIDYSCVKLLESYLSSHGFSSITQVSIDIPMGWGDEAGQLYGQNSFLAWWAVGAILQPILKMNKEEFEQLMVNTFAEFKRIKTINRGYFAYGKKLEGA